MKISGRGKDFYWIRSGFFTILQNLSGVFFGFATFYLLVHYLLDEHAFGSWTLFLSTVTVLEIVRSGLVQNALIKFISGSDEEDHSKIISSSFVITGILTLGCIVISLLFAPLLANAWDSPELVPIFQLYNVVFLLSGILVQLNCIEQANLKFRGIFISSFVRQGTFTGYLFLCFIFNIKIELINLVYLQIVTVLISLVLSYRYVRPHLLLSFKIYPEWIKRMFHFSKYAFGTSVSGILANTIDQMMLGAMISPAASGAFNVAVRITNLVDIPTNAVATIVFPQSAMRIESEGKEAIKYLYEKSVGILMAILIPAVLFLFLFSDQIVYLIAGNNYEDAVPLLHVTLLYCLLIPYGRQVGTILDSIGKTRATFFIVLATASINISLNYPLITWLGIMGAAYASLISAIIGFFIAKIVLRKELNIRMRNTLIYAYKFYPEMYSKYHLRVKRVLYSRMKGKKYFPGSENNKQ